MQTGNPLRGDDTPSELIQFARLREACQANDPQAALTSLVLWLGIFCQVEGSADVTTLASELGEDHLAEQIIELRVAAGSPTASWSGTELLNVLDCLRLSVLKKAQSTSQRQLTDVLLSKDHKQGRSMQR
jgi:hypothetical protein